MVNVPESPVQSPPKATAYVPSIWLPLTVAVRLMCTDVPATIAPVHWFPAIWPEKLTLEKHGEPLT